MTHATRETSADPQQPASFERDSLVWSLGKLAELAVRHFFRESSASARYACWLSEGAQRCTDASGFESGLLLVGLELGADGNVRLEARPSAGQFLLRVAHPQFHALVAVSHRSLSARKQSDGVCLAHFEGNPELATRWALGVRSWLTRRWQSRNDAALPGAGALN